MDNNFMENCKLLKKHFTKLTPQCLTDESTQSIYKTNKTKCIKTKEIIEDAKKLLLEEKLDILCDTDLEELKQNTLAYARHLEEYGKTKISYRNCQKNQNIIQWNDEIFSTPLPHPKYNLEFIKAQINCDKDNKMIDRIDDIQTRKNEVVVVNCSKTVSTCTVETIEDLEESKTNGHFKGDTINEEENKNDVLELNIMPQCQNSIENLLQIKKMNLEDNVLTNNFDEVLIVSNTENSKMELLKKSVNKWKTVITKKNNNYEKTENQPLNKHNKKIDDFLQNIQKYQAKSKSATNVELEKTKEEKKKPKSSTSLDNKISSYQYRFKAQKNIIEMQKEKLQEQVKIIEELKLNKIYQQASDSLKEAQKTKRSLSPQKVKQVKKKVNEENDKEENERTNQNPSLYFTKAPKIVVQMEERAKEREEKRLIIKERRRLIEEDKKKQMELVLQKKMRDEMEERDKQKEKMRVQRERVRQLEIKRQQDKKRYIELNEIAQRHYKIKLMKNNGMDHFKMLIFRIRINMEIAKRFYENNLIINCFEIWKTFTQKEICYKNELADELYNSRILKIALRNWKTYHLQSVQSTQAAVDWYEVKLQIRFLKYWHLSATENRLKYICDLAKAQKHHEKLILFQSFESWRSFPALMEIERIQNERKRKWRLRVAQILSDYDPLKNYE